MPSPPYHASDCKGETIKGNDNKLYKSVPDKRGVYTWKLVTINNNKTRKQIKAKNSYQTHHNGDRPFLVEVNSDKKEIDVKSISRLSPPYNASDYKGEIIRGIDNRLYISVADKRGVYTWKLQTVTNITRNHKKGKKSYQTHYNGDRPFLVEVNTDKKEIDVYKLMYDETVKKHIIDVYKGFYKYKNIWIGNGPVPVGLKSEKYPGHAILAHLTNGDMLFIGHKVFTFNMLAGDKPEKFISYVGNNDVVYSYLVGKTHTYLLQEEIVIENEKLDEKEDAYKQYYVDKVPGKKFRIKTIAK